MRRNVIAGVGASIGTVLASWAVTLAVAAGIMSPVVNWNEGGDAVVSWNRHTSTLVDHYRVIQCPYVSAPAAKCLPVVELPAEAYEGFVAVISASTVMTNTNAVVKVIAEDRDVVPIKEVARENVRLHAADGTPTPPAGDTIPLAEGCQLNIAVGQWPSDAMKKVVDAGGVATIEDVGAVYQLTLKKVGLHEDDSSLVDLRDYEHECRTSIAHIAR